MNLTWDHLWQTACVRGIRQTNVTQPVKSRCPETRAAYVCLRINDGKRQTIKSIANRGLSLPLRHERPAFNLWDTLLSSK